MALWYLAPKAYKLGSVSHAIVREDTEQKARQEVDSWDAEGGWLFDEFTECTCIAAAGENGYLIISGR
jgi:hypothetical protein